MKDLICEGNGDVSSVRIYMWLGLAIALGITIYSIATNHVNEDLPLIGIWMSPVFGKVIQKFSEQKVVS